MTPNTPPTIMLVDDDRDLLALMRNGLEKAGFRVDARDTAPDRKDIVEAHPSVIFMDVGLLQENGAALCRAIKEDLGPDQPVVLISGHDDDSLHQEAALAHADACMTKPFTVEALRALATYYAPEGSVGNS